MLAKVDVESEAILAKDDAVLSFCAPVRGYITTSAGSGGHTIGRTAKTHDLASTSLTCARGTGIRTLARVQNTGDGPPPLGLGRSLFRTVAKVRDLRHVVQRVWGERRKGRGGCGNMCTARTVATINHLSQSSV